MSSQQTIVLNNLRSGSLVICCPALKTDRRTDRYIYSNRKNTMIGYIIESWSGDLHYKAKILPLAQRPPLQMIFNKKIENHKNKLGMNRYTVGSIVSDEISILLHYYLQM